MDSPRREIEKMNEWIWARNLVAFIILVVVCILWTAWLLLMLFCVDYGEPM